MLHGLKCFISIELSKPWSALNTMKTSTSVIFALWAIFFALVGIYTKIPNTENIKETTPNKTSSEQITEVVGVGGSNFDGFGITTGFIVRMPNGELKEVPYEKILDVPSTPHKVGDWKPKYLNVLTEDGRITLAHQKSFEPF